MALLEGVFLGFDTEILVFGILFVAILAIIMFVFGKIRLFQESQGTKAIVGICVSLLAIYGLLRSSWNVENLFYTLGLGEGGIYNLALLAIIGFLIITSTVRNKTTGRIGFRLYRPLILLGLIFIGLKLAKISYGERALYIGIGLLVLGLILWYRAYKKGLTSERQRGWTPKQIIDYKRASKKKDKLRDQYRSQRGRNSRESSSGKSKLPVILIVAGVLIIGATSVLGFATKYFILGIAVVVLGLIIAPILRFIGLSGGR